MGEVERLLGSHVVLAESVSLGFSPAVAARLRLSDGRSVFAKAVLVSWNQETFEMHQREARIAAALPDGTPAPKLLHLVAVDDAVALIFELAQGRPPLLPWRREELNVVLAAVEQLALTLTPSPIDCEPASEMPGFADGFSLLRGLRDRQGDHLSDLDPWVLAHLDQLVELERGYPEAARGETLCHFDLRQDNILINRGEVRFVDWPQARVGPAWLDLAGMLPSVAMQGGPPPWELFPTHPLGRRAPREGTLSFVAAMSGYLLHRQRLPAPPGIPTLRAFQRAQAGPSLAWLRRLLSNG
ncbi:MAG: aminoglycoside phosphotransferase family protein [Candidatus Dormibacteria bacterium]